MNNSRQTLIRWQDFPAALGLLTRLPVRVDPEIAVARGAAAAWCFPIVGAITGMIAAAVAWMAMAVGLNQAIAAGLALVTLVLLTGAMHEDGLADSADGLWGGWTKDRRLEIMKDSRIGAYGVLALTFSMLLRWSALSSVGPFLAPTLIASAILSRTAVVVIWSALPPARTSGLSASSGQPGLLTTVLAGVIGLGLSILVLQSVTAGLICAVLSGIGLVALAVLAIRRIGGQTGDILGASQQISEIIALIALSAILA